MDINLRILNWILGWHTLWANRNCCALKPAAVKGRSFEAERTEVAALEANARCIL